MRKLDKKNIRILGIVVVTLLFSCVFQGCSSKDDSIYLKLGYEDEINNGSGSSKLDTAKKNLKGNDVCIVQKGKDVGGDKEITAPSTLLFNKTDKKVLYANNIYTKQFPASITKVATSLVLLEQIKAQKVKWDDMVTFGSNTTKITVKGAKLTGLKEGDKIKLLDLFYFLLLESANDAGVAIAEHVGGSQEKFADMMNEAAKRVGAVDSHFVNPHGLHNNDHYTTAYDIYLIYNKALEYDIFKKVSGTKAYKLNYTTKEGKTVTKQIKNTNHYFTGESEAPAGVTVLGGKTGTTEQAGNCLVMLSGCNNKEYISLILHIDYEHKEDLYNQMSLLIKKETK